MVLDACLDARSGQGGAIVETYKLS